MKGTSMQDSLTFKSYEKPSAKRPSAPIPGDYTPSLIQSTCEPYDIITGTFFFTFNDLHPHDY